MSLFGFIPFVFVDVVAHTACAARAVAQTTAGAPDLAIEAGAIVVQQPNRPAITAGTVSLSARRTTTHSAAHASGLLIRTSDSSTAAQATLGAEVAWPKHPSLRLEISGTATSFGVLSTDHGSSRDGLVRPHYVRESFGVFGTLGAGTVRRNRAGQHALAWDAGAWTHRGTFTGVLSLRRSFTNDSLLMEASNFFLSRAAQHYAVQDVHGVVTARVSRFEFLASAALRTGVGATIGRGKALFASLTAGLTPRFGLVISGGRQLAEPLSGVPSANLFGASLRVGVLGGNSNPAVRPIANVVAISSPFTTRIERHSTGGATVTVRVDAPVGAVVELMGSFNNWTSLPMTRIGSAFELTIELPRGTHRLAVRVNGGEWKAPPGLARVKDEMGGESGIVVVP